MQVAFEYILVNQSKPRGLKWLTISDWIEFSVCYSLRLVRGWGTLQDFLCHSVACYLEAMDECLVDFSSSD